MWSSYLYARPFWTSNLQQDYITRQKDQIFVRVDLPRIHILALFPGSVTLLGKSQSPQFWHSTMAIPEETNISFGLDLLVGFSSQFSGGGCQGGEILVRIIHIGP